MRQRNKLLRNEEVKIKLEICRGKKKIKLSWVADCFKIYKGFAVVVCRGFYAGQKAKRSKYRYGIGLLLRFVRVIKNAKPRKK